MSVLDDPARSADDPVSMRGSGDLVSMPDLWGIMLPAVLGSGGWSVPLTCGDHFGEPGTGD